MKKLTSIIIFLNLFFINTITFAKEINAYTKYPSYSDMFLGEDKYEKFNRKMFDINLKMNRIIVKKIHTLWASLVPMPIIDALNWAYVNIEYPKRLVSCILQKDLEGIKHETKRFIINSTIGLAGLFDAANKIFKLELYNEDMEQALAKCKCKCGNYLVMPFISSTTSRDLFGRILDFVLTPTTYIATPVAAAIKMALLINRTTQIQPIIKMVESNFIDPYDIAKKVYGVEKYIKLSNYDRKNVIENIKNEYNEIDLVDNTKEHLEVKGKVEDKDNLYVNLTPEIELSADIFLNDYNPQSPVLDSIRTALFDLKDEKNSIWQEISIWNRDFNKKLKTASVEIAKDRPKYSFRYLLQKDKSSPLAIIFPSIGEGKNNSHNIIFAKMFYDEGYSVVLIGSHFQWEFLKSIEKYHAIGNIQEDVKFINILLNNITDYLSKKHERPFLKRIAIGTSLGAYTVMFLANSQYQDRANNIDHFIAICPPFDLTCAIKQLDKIISSWKNQPENLNDTVASVTAKVMRAYKEKNINKENLNKLPFSKYEGELISAFIFHQKLSDLVFELETDKNPNIDKKELYEAIHKMDYSDYINKYLLVNYTYEELASMNNFKAISNYLINKDNYKIYHSLDDYLINKNQLKELRQYCDNKLVLFNNGAHLGFLYRDEFINELKKDIQRFKNFN